MAKDKEDETIDGNGNMFAEKRKRIEDKGGFKWDSSGEKRSISVVSSISSVELSSICRWINKVLPGGLMIIANATFHLVTFYWL